MTSADMRDFLKTKATDFQKFYAGKFDPKHTKVLCIYSRKNGDAPNISIGGINQTITKQASFSLLIHYDTNYTNTEKAAASLFNKLFEVVNETFKNYQINYIRLDNSYPVDIHCDDNGIYERVIDFTIYFSIL